MCVCVCVYCFFVSLLLFWGVVLRDYLLRQLIRLCGAGGAAGRGRGGGSKELPTVITANSHTQKRRNCLPC